MGHSTKRIVSSLLLAGAAAGLGVACGDANFAPEDAPTSSTPAQTSNVARQAATQPDDISQYSGLILGQGVRPNDPGGYAANSCVKATKENTQITLLNNVQATAFASSSRSEFELEADGKLEAGANIEGIKLDASQEASAYYQNIEDEDLFTLMVRIDTVRAQTDA